MSNPIKGLVAVTSDYGIGKTTFALECGYHPGDIIFVNDDIKEPGSNDEDENSLSHSDFAQYIDLVKQSEGMKLLDFHAHCNNLIDNLPEAKVIIWDTWTHCQNTFPTYVKANLGQFRNPNEWSAMGKMKTGEIYNESYQYEGIWLTKLKNKCDLLILTFHLKQLYLNNVAVPSKYKPGHDKAIEKYADLRLWLTPNPDSQVPIGLVMKNIGRRTITEKGIKTQQVLPLRLSRCNWDTILDYWQNPIGDRLPEDNERPNSFELSLIEGTLTPEQKRMYEMSVSIVEKSEAEDRLEELKIKQDQESEIRDFITANLATLPLPGIFAKVRQAIDNGQLIYDNELTIDDIRKITNE